jgi:hypothetical protein
MARTSRDSAPRVADCGPAEDHTDHFDGYTVNFTSIREDSDLAPLLKGLPGDSCQCPHWGYMIAGRLAVRYADHEEVIEPGDAFYLPPVTCQPHRPDPSSSCSAPKKNSRCQRRH